MVGVAAFPGEPTRKALAPRLLLLAVVVLIVVGCREAGAGHPSDLPVLHALPEFELLAEEGVPARFLSLDVHPEHDRPAALANYRDEWGGSEETWRTLTGPLEDVAALTEGLQLPVNFSTQPVDRQARVRGYYSSTAAADIDRLRRDIGILAGAES